MRARRLTPILTAAALGIALAAPAAAIVPGANGRISFERAVPAAGGFFQGDLWTVGADGTGPLPLRTTARTESDASWAPSGLQLVFQRYVRGTDPNEVHELAVVGGDGSGFRQLTHLGSFTTAPSWSPDGRRILFASDYQTKRRFPQRGTGPAPPLQIYSMAADGSDIRRLTRTRGGVGGMECVSPVMAPDARRIAVFCATFGPRAPRNAGIYLLPAAGGPLRRLSPDGGVAEVNPGWSPDGRSIAYEVDHFLGRPRPTQRNDIAIMSAEGTGIRTIAQTPWSETNPVFSPDGTKLAFTSDRDTRPPRRPGEPLQHLNAGFELYTVDLATNAVTRLTRNGTPDLFPDWGPAPPGR